MLLWDSETDGLLEATDTVPAMTRVHCVVMRDVGGPIARYHDQPDLPREGTLAQGLERLERAPAVAAHGNFDLHAVRKVHPTFRAHAEPGVTDLDTEIIARTILPDEELKIQDIVRPRFPKDLAGRHSIEAWGSRLGIPKVGKDETFETLTPGLLARCVRDVEVLTALWAHLQSHRPTSLQIHLEHRFAAAIRKMERRGAAFDVPAAGRLVGRLCARRAELDDALRGSFPDFTEEYVTPVRKEHKTRTITFNPNSRVHVARGLVEKYGWAPVQYTDSGQVKLDEQVVGALPYPEAPVIAERLMVQKRIGTVSEGEHAYMKLVRPDGRIYGICRHNAARTSRCAHSKPNLANITGVLDKGGSPQPWGREIRECFIAGPGMELVDSDASGVEARVMGHYAVPIDGGKLAEVILTGDIHTMNAEALETTRPSAKRFFYALLYGAKDRKLGKILGGGPDAGARGRARLMSRVPGIGKVMSVVESEAKAKGRIPTIDGRLLWTDDRRAYNTLIQGGSSIIMKMVVVLIGDRLAAKFPESGLVMFIHDEPVVECPEGQGEEIGRLCSQAVTDAGKILGVRVPLGGSYKVGKNLAVGH